MGSMFLICFAADFFTEDGISDGNEIKEFLTIAHRWMAR
jgi:hypothetical protein